MGNSTNRESDLLKKASEFFAKRKTLLSDSNPVYAKATLHGIKTEDPLLGIESRSSRDFLEYMGE